MRKILKGLGVVASAMLLTCAFFTGKAEADTEYLATINVTDYGVDGTDNEDDYAGFEAAMRAAAGMDNPDNKMVLVNVPKGTYYLSDGIPVFSNIYLKLDDNAVIKRLDLSQEMIKNWHFNEDGYLCYYSKEEGKECNHGGYTQFQNVVIEGGIWDGSVDDNTAVSYSNLFMFYHGKNLAIKNTTIKNTTSAHMIMLDGVKDAIIENVNFKDCYLFTGNDKSYNHGISNPSSYSDKVNIASSKEAIHTDVTNAVGSTAYPLDNTICENISITKCNFDNILTAVGSHHGDDFTQDLYSKNISITDCTATNITGNFVNNFRMKDTVLKNNNVNGAHYYIHTSIGTVKSQNNVVTNIDSAALVQKKSEVTSESDNICVKGTSVFKAYTLYADGESTVNLSNITMNSAIQGLIHVQDSTLNINKATLSQSVDGYGITVDNSAASIDGVKISAASANKDGVKINSCVDKKVEVKSCDISGMNKCIVVMGGSNNVTISGNKLYNAKDNTIQVDSASAVITNNEIYNVVTGRAAIRVDGSKYNTNMIKGNKIYQSKGNGIYITNSLGDIKENEIDGCSDTAIRVHECTGVNILNNQCINSGNRDIILKGCNQCVCKYNTITGAVKDDIYTDTDTNIISDNTAKDALNGWIKYGDNWYYYVNGTMKTKSWIGSGKNWYYVNGSGVMVANDWANVDGKWYHFKKDGLMRTGWQQISGKWYYFDGSGAMKTKSWIGSGKNWYYVNGDGIMVASDWAKVGSKWYHFNKDGLMQVGWQQISGKWYYFDGSGAMKSKSWIGSGKNWYYVKGDGEMVANNWAYIGGKWYHFNKNGLMRTGWQMLSGDWYYFDTISGEMYTGTHTIDGKKYTFSADGVLQ